MYSLYYIKTSDKVHGFSRLWRKHTFSSVAWYPKFSLFHPYFHFLFSFLLTFFMFVYTYSNLRFPSSANTALSMDAILFLLISLDQEKNSIAFYMFEKLLSFQVSQLT